MRVISEPYLYGFGRCLAPSNWSFQKMSGCNRVYVIYGGSGWYWDGGAERKFLPGRIYLLPMRADFRVRQLGSDPLDHMFFDFSLTPPFSSGRVSSLDLSSKGGLMEPIRRVVEVLELLTAQPERAAHEAIPAVFAGLLRLLCAETRQSLSSDPRVEAALERIHRIAPDGSLELPGNDELARLLHIDVNHFIRIFRREVGVTPHRYMLSHRLNMAAAYIEAGMQVSDAARLVGYESVSALSHAMRRRKEALEK